MTLHQLAVLCAVLEHRSFTRAAEVLRVSQPAISAQIKALEKEFGCSLFKRQPGTGEVEPTPAGQIAYRAALKIFERISLLEEELRTLREETTGHNHALRVVCDLATGVYTLPRLLKEFQKQVSHLQVIVTPTPHEALPALLSARNYDLAIVPRETPTPAAVQEFTFGAALVAAANPTLLVENGEVAPDWACLPWAAPPEGSILRRHIDTYFKKLKIKPNIVVEFNHPEAIKALIRTEPVAAITHRVSVQEDLEAGTLVELDPPQPLPQLIYKVVRTRSRLGEHVRAFTSFLRERVQLELAYAGRGQAGPVD